jgi:hypothetical protein
MSATEQAPNWFAFIETQGKRLRVGWFIGLRTLAVGERNGPHAGKHDRPARYHARYQRQALRLR